ncbi:microtubule-associated protein futsch [Bacillus rossius redtenbacheri]|uniref:microtubule-associated protein futsch n=1 Tax=Bacillus rossius redtenbacheri TaxID=93214 RepID=UPI002FDD9172
MSNFSSNNMYYRHGGRNHEAHPSGNMGSGGSRPQFWSDSFSSYGKTVDPYRQHGYPAQTQSAWQHQPFPQQWSQSQWGAPVAQAAPFRKDQMQNQHPYKSGHHPPASYKYKKSFGGYERGRSSPVKEEDPLPGSEEERKKMLAQETDKVKKCLMSFKNEQSTSVGSSGYREKDKSSADASSKEHRDNRERGSSSRNSSSSQRNVSHKDREKQSSHSSSNYSGHATWKSAPSKCSSEGTNKHTKKPNHSHKHNNSNQSSKESYSLNSRDNHSSTEGSTQVRSSSKSEINNVPQALGQQKKSKSGSNSETKQTVPSGTAKQVVSSPKIISNDELNSSLNEGNGENEVQVKVKHLKDRIVRHILGMTTSHMKDFINKPTSRRFEFAMKHLVKERQELVSKEQRGFANSRIRTQSTGSLDEGEILNENTCLDTNVSVDLASLPAEVIEHLGNLLQVDLLKCVEESTSLEKSLCEGYNDCIIDFENLKAFANTLPNNENIFAFIEEKPDVTEIAIKQEVMNPWEDAAEPSRISVQPSSEAGDITDDHELQESQVLHESQNVDESTDSNTLHPDLQDRLSCQGSEVVSSSLSLPQWAGDNSFPGLQEQPCTSFPSDVDGWNKSASADLTLQSLEMTEKLIDKIEQMTTVNSDCSQSANNNNNNNNNREEHSTELIGVIESVVEEEGTAKEKGYREENRAEEIAQLTDVNNMENNCVGKEIDAEESNKDNTVIEKQPDHLRLGDENICPTEIVESQKCDDMNESDITDTKENCAKDVPDEVDIIVTEGNNTDKAIEIITIPDDETSMEGQGKILPDQMETKPGELFCDSESKMVVEDSHLNENDISQNKTSFSDEPPIVSGLKTEEESFVHVLETPIDEFLPTEEPVEEGALINDKCLASAVISETETAEEEAPMSLSPLETKYLVMPAVTEDLVEAPGLSEELGECGGGGSGLFSVSLGLDEAAAEERKESKESEKEWPACGASEMQYGPQGSGNAEFRNLFCELPDLETEPADVAPDGATSPRPAGGETAGVAVAGPGSRPGVCSTSTAARNDLPAGYSPASAQVRPAAEACTQTELVEELTPRDVEKMLQLLEKSRQLSPQLAKLLRDHFSLIKSSQEKHFEPCRLSRESRREIWNRSKKGKPKQIKGFSQHGGRVNISNYGGSRTPSETPDLMEDSVDKVRENNETHRSTSPREDLEESASDVEKTIFLEMLGIDKEIQRLMDQKLRLYMRLRLNMSGERLNFGHYSPRMPPPQDRVSSQLCNMSTPISPILDVPTDESELPQKGGAPVEQSVNKNLLRPPVVILPHSYEKPLYNESADETSSAACAPMLDSMFPRISAVNKRLKLMDTTVVEQVLNSFTMPDSQEDKSASSKTGNILSVLENEPQGENYAVGGIKPHSNSTLSNDADVGKSAASEDLIDSSTKVRPRTKKNKAQSKYISEKVEPILSENLNISGAVKPVTDELPDRKSTSHTISHASDDDLCSKSSKSIICNADSSKEFETITSVSGVHKLDLPSSETSVSALELTTDEKYDLNNGENQVPSKSAEKISNPLSENTLVSKKVDELSEEAVFSENLTACSKDSVLPEDEKVSPEYILADSKSDDKETTILEDFKPVSLTGKHDSFSNEKQPLTSTDNLTTKSARRKTDKTKELVKSHARSKAKQSPVSACSSVVKHTDEALSTDKIKLESSLTDKTDRHAHEPLTTETVSNVSSRTTGVKQQTTSAERSSQKSKGSTDKNANVSAEKSSKLKQSSSEKGKTDSTNKPSKSDKNKHSSEKSVRQSRQTKAGIKDQISPVKSSAHAKTGRLDSNKVISDEIESSVSTELVVTPRKSSSRSKSTAKKSPVRNSKEKQVVPSVESETSRTRRLGKRPSKTVENVDSIAVEADAPVLCHIEDSSSKRAKKSPVTKVHDSDGKQNELDKGEEKVATSTRKGKQNKLGDGPQNVVDFTKPHSTPKKPSRSARRTKESPVSTVSATEGEAESSEPEVKKSDVEPLEPSSETVTRHKRKRSKAVDDDPADSSPLAKRTKTRETTASASEDDPDAPVSQGKRSTRLRRASSRLDSDQRGASSDASDSNPSSGRRSLGRTARTTKSYSDYHVEDDVLDEGRKKRTRRVSRCESVKSDVSKSEISKREVSENNVSINDELTMQVAEVEQSLNMVDSENKNKDFDDVPLVQLKEETPAVQELTVKQCSVSLTRIRVDPVISSEDNPGETVDLEPEPASHALEHVWALSDSGSAVPEETRVGPEGDSGLPAWAEDARSGYCTPGSTDPQGESAATDDNSISTLVSDSVSLMSDGEQRRARGENTDCDRDSTHSTETSVEGGGQAGKHKLSRKHRREKKSDTPEHLTFETHTGPILHLKTVGRHVLAACEDGAVYSYSLKSGKYKGRYEGHAAAVTCLCVLEFSPRTGGETPSDLDGEHDTPAHVFTGSLDRHLRGFVFRTGEAVFDPVSIGSPVQCMDHNWGYLYLGTQAGEVARFNIQKACLTGEHLKLSNEAVLSLIATKEGPRKVLVVGTRSSPITIRDATNGLLLRSVSGTGGHTAYSLLLENSLVYCGTSADAILAFEFTSGKEVCQLKAGCSVVCMTSYNNMLFAGCYDGNIYVFSLQDKKHITTIAGPGKMLLCMDIVKNRVIAGCKQGNKLEAWSFPAELKTLAKEAKQHR